MQTEAFKEAIKMLEQTARPFLARTDTQDSRATRQAYQAGFVDCIELLQKLAVYDKKTEEAVVFSEWGHYGQPDNSQS